MGEVETKVWMRDGLEVALGGDREAGLDDVDAHLVEAVGDLELLLEGHRCTRALFAVAQGGVENNDAVARCLSGGRVRCLGGHGMSGPSSGRSQCGAG
jgi:hypothetical protein